MFGYIRICKPQMKICEYEIYRSVYCTLCRRLGRQLGLPARMLLNYDYTFMTLLMIALSGEPAQFVPGRCAFNPVKKCGLCTTHEKAYDYTAALTGIMFYHKLRDDLNDSTGTRRLARRLLQPYAALVRSRARRRFPQEDAWVDEYIRRQVEAERRTAETGEVSIDELCEPTADVIASFARKLSDSERDGVVLRHFGYFLGRWIYLIDALDDLADDLEAGAFNPLALKFGLCAEDARNDSDLYEEARCFGNDSLNHSLSEAVKYYELLELGAYKPILDNIMYLGLSGAQESALLPKEDKERARRCFRRKKRNGQTEIQQTEIQQTEIQEQL